VLVIVRSTWEPGDLEWEAIFLPQHSAAALAACAALWEADPAAGYSIRTCWLGDGVDLWDVARGDNE
jgi:hypothetical protein